VPVHEIEAGQARISTHLLSRDGQARTLLNHVLVALTFLGGPPPPEQNQVNHLNGTWGLPTPDANTFADIDAGLLRALACCRSLRLSAPYNSNDLCKLITEEPRDVCHSYQG
jgi:hypothetical protein